MSYNLSRLTLSATCLLLSPHPLWNNLGWMCILVSCPFGFVNIIVSGLMDKWMHKEESIDPANRRDSEGAQISIKVKLLLFFVFWWVVDHLIVIICLAMDLRNESSLAYSNPLFMISYCGTFIGGAGQYILLSLPLYYYYFVGQYEVTELVNSENQSIMAADPDREAT